VNTISLIAISIFFPYIDPFEVVECNILLPKKLRVMTPNTPYPNYIAEDTPPVNKIQQGN
jgi:hypothetical protein